MRRRALVDPGRLLEVIGVEGELLATLATSADHDFDVPWCPGMTLGETVRHVGSVYRMVVSWLRAGDRPSGWQRVPGEDQSTEDYLREGLRELLDELSAHDAEESCATWWPEHPIYEFWCRRMAHESTVHRVDVQASTGARVEVIAEEVAIDGVDEILTLWFTHRLAVQGVKGTRFGRVAVRTGGRDWIAQATPTGTSAWPVGPDEIDQVGATVTGDPVNVYLWLWGRRPMWEIHEDGDHDAVAQMWALLRLATR
jgi:uncharacterized protein (TIGR03083 family)